MTERERERERERDFGELLTGYVGAIPTGIKERRRGEEKRIGKQYNNNALFVDSTE